jgi:nicotinamidase/pyrazinamidase
MEKVFDIVVDAQNDFMRADGKLYVAGAEAIIPALQSYLANLDSCGVLFTYDTHLVGVYETSEEAKQFPIHCIRGSEGWQLAVDPSVAHVPVYTMEKGVFDMWSEPTLFLHHRDEMDDRDFFFEGLKAAGVTKIRVTGVAADYCVKWAIDGLVARGFEVEVMGDLTVGIQRGIEQVVQEDFATQPVVIG